MSGYDNMPPEWTPLGSITITKALTESGEVATNVHVDDGLGIYEVIGMLRVTCATQERLLLDAWRDDD